jgi:hypothetical protein
MVIEYGAPMPAASPIQHRTERVVGNTESGSYREAQSVVATSGSLREAVVSSNFLDGFEDQHRAETIAVLEALPPEVDAAFMASLRGALEQNAKIAFAWREGDFAHEATTDEDGTVRLWLQCPHGSSFTG